MKPPSCDTGAAHSTRHVVWRCRWLVCLVACGLVGGWVAVGDAAEAGRPNVLFFFADDMRADSIGALGNPDVKTPVLDALVERGFVFRNAYCLGGNSAAVCTPSRNMLLSGRAYFRWKDFLAPGAKPPRRGSIAPPDPPNWPLSFREAGYQTYHHGKRGNTAPLIQALFDVNKYLANEADERRSGEPGREIADAAIEFLRQGRDDRPFCMYLAFGNPHDPRIAGQKYLDLYRRDALALPKNFRPVHPFDNGEMTIRDELLAPWPRSPQVIRQQLLDYYAVISSLDYHIGRVLQTLEELRLDDNTIVLFAADQGVSLGSHGLLGKQNLYDEAMKAPLILAGPGIRRGSSDALIYLLDIYPTLCDLVGAPLPAGIDGRTFRPVIDGVGPGPRQELLLAYLDLQRAIRDERYKLIRYPQVDVTQLFDLRSDPDEMHDLAHLPEQADRVARMLERLKRLQPRFGDDLPLSVDQPKDPNWTPPTGATLQALYDRWGIQRN